MILVDQVLALGLGKTGKGGFWVNFVSLVLGLHAQHATETLGMPPCPPFVRARRYRRRHLMPINGICSPQSM